MKTDKCSYIGCNKDTTKIFKLQYHDMSVCDEHYDVLADFQRKVRIAQGYAQIHKTKIEEGKGGKNESDRAGENIGNEIISA